MGTCVQLIILSLSPSLSPSPSPSPFPFPSLPPGLEVADTIVITADNISNKVLGGTTEAQVPALLLGLASHTHNHTHTITHTITHTQSHTHTHTHTHTHAIPLCLVCSPSSLPHISVFHCLLKHSFSLSLSLSLDLQVRATLRNYIPDFDIEVRSIERERERERERGCGDPKHENLKNFLFFKGISPDSFTKRRAHL